MFRSRRTNKRYLLALAALLVLLWVPAIFWIANGAPPQSGPDDSFSVVVLIYYIAVSVPALCLSLYALIHAPVGLIRNAGVRMVHFGQLVTALALLLTLTPIALFAYLMSTGGPG